MIAMYSDWLINTRLLWELENRGSELNVKHNFLNQNLFEKLTRSEK